MRQKFDWVVLSNPPYGPDLAIINFSSTYKIFLLVQNFLKETCENEPVKFFNHRNGISISVFKMDKSCRITRHIFDLFKPDNPNYSNAIDTTYHILKSPFPPLLK